VRPYLAREVVPALEADATSLGPAVDAVREAAQRRFREQIVPSVERVFGAPAMMGLSFPWDRLFEVDVELPDDTQGL